MKRKSKLLRRILSMCFVALIVFCVIEPSASYGTELEDDASTDTTDELVENEIQVSEDVDESEDIQISKSSESLKDDMQEENTEGEGTAVVEESAQEKLDEDSLNDIVIEEGETDILVNNGSDEIETHAKYGDLSVSNTVSDNKELYLNYIVTFAGSDVPTELSYVIEQSGTDDVGGTMQLTENTATFNLKDGQTVVFSQVPFGIEYNVLETDGETYDYTVRYENQSGTINGDVAVTVSNSKAVVVPTGVNINMNVMLFITISSLAVISFVLQQRSKK